MSDHTTEHNEPQQHLRQDTTQSGRIVRDVLVWLLSLTAAVVGFCFAYDDKLRGNSDAEIAEFDASLRAYIRSATQGKFPRLLLMSTHVPELFGFEEQTARLQHSINRLRVENKIVAIDRFDRGVLEYNIAHGNQVFVSPDEPHNRIPINWVKKNTFEAILRGLWVSALSAIGAWIATWLLCLGLSLIWWFMIDRLRDISRAIKSQ